MSTIPTPKDPAEATRWGHVALVRRILYEEHERDVQGRLTSASGDVRRQAWGIADLSANALRQTADQLARSHDATPAISAPDAAGQELVQLVARSGHWSRMPIIERDAWALGEMLLRVDLDRDGAPTYDIVPPDRIIAQPDPEHPGRPVRIEHLRSRQVPGMARDANGRFAGKKHVWCWDVLDISDPEDPIFRVLLDEGSEVDTGLPRDLTALFFGSEQSGALYPYRDAKGRPILPYAFVRCADSGRMWNTFRWRGLVDGTLTLGVYYSFFGHILRACSWPQRYAINAEVAGATHVDEEGQGSGRQALVADPATVVMLRSLADSAAQPQVGQWAPGGDPEVVLRAVQSYHRGLATHAGLAGSDLVGDPRSGFSLSVSRTALREQLRRAEPVLRACDLELLRITAALLSRATGKAYPEEGYAITYTGVPESPEERAAKLADVTTRLQAGLIDRISAYMELNPGTSRADAEAAIIEIARLNRATA